MHRWMLHTDTWCTVLTLESSGANEIHHFMRHSSSSKERDYADSGCGKRTLYYTVLEVILKPEQLHMNYYRIYYSLSGRSS
jgi:hypothetical protein